MTVVRISAVCVLLMAAAAFAGDLKVQLPKTEKAASASATATGLDARIEGTIEEGIVHFKNLLADTLYDVKIVLDDGTVLQGIDMSWYNDDPPKTNAGDFTDDDRKEIQGIMDVPSFYSKSDIVKLNADHDRAVVLAQLIRDRAFVNDKGGEVIWRIELWYFKNEYGGWAKINQVNKVVRRERFPSHEKYEEVTNKLKWTPELGGISLAKDKNLTVQILPDAPPATKPTDPDAEN